MHRLIQVGMFDIIPKWQHYSLWECYQAGMYGNEQREYVIKQCYDLFRRVDLYNLMKEVCTKWRTSARVNLGQQVMNRRPWVGQSVCCFNIGSTAIETSMAWVMLTIHERDRANTIANKVIEEWENEIIWQ